MADRAVSPIPGGKPLGTISRLLGNGIGKSHVGFHAPSVAFAGSMGSRSASQPSMPRRRHTISDAPQRGQLLTLENGGGAGSRSGSRRPSKVRLFPQAESEDAARAAAESQACKLDFAPRTKVDNVDFTACRLAARHRLTLHEVKGIMKELDVAKHTEAGGIDRGEFDRALCRIFSVPAVDQRVAKGAYDAMGSKDQINIDLFLSWYVQNMFTQVNALNADASKTASNTMTYDLSRKHGVSSVIIDKIKEKFDQFDANSSGHIDYGEFEQMFCVILKAKTVSDVNPDRIKKFWSQVEMESDGLSFPCFVNWYLKYFCPDADNDKGSAAGFDVLKPLYAFYDSFDPTVARHNARRQSALVADGRRATVDH